MDSPNEVFEFACSLGDITPDKVRSSKRDSNIIDVRQAFSLFMGDELNNTEIARIMNVGRTLISHYKHDRPVTPNTRRILDSLNKSYANDISKWARKLAIDPQNDYLKSKLKELL